METLSLLRISLFPNPNPNPNFIRSLPFPRLHRHRHLRPLASINTLPPSNPPTLPPNPNPNPNPILLEVQGMMCGACSSRVKSALSSDPRVESAAVNMVTDTAAVVLRSGESSAAAAAEELAARLTGLGFPSRRRGEGAGTGARVKKWREMKERKEMLLARSRNRVVFAWTLVGLCCGSHASHLLHSVGIHIAHGKSLIFS